MSILYPHQREALTKLKTGSILCGGVGTGKTVVSIAYFLQVAKEKEFKNLYIITTAQTRDKGGWEKDLNKFGLSTQEPDSEVRINVDSWNNITKYLSVPKDSFFIFDEQRVVGSGTWVKTFLKITKHYDWIMLSATPGDTWTDYIPVFIANGFYKNRSEFLDQHAIFARTLKFPKIVKFVNVTKLERLRREITVTMTCERHTTQHHSYIPVVYDRELYDTVSVQRWNPYENEPIQDISGACYLMRKVVNHDMSRMDAITTLMEKHPRMIIFYNFDYELERLRNLEALRPIAEWNGHKHQQIPKTDEWLYLVQYTAGAEGWNCTSTDTIVFYSQNYSYKIMIQAAGRIDRLNTLYSDLHYYHLKSNAPIDDAVSRALKNKKTFNENLFLKDW